MNILIKGANKDNFKELIMFRLLLLEYSFQIDSTISYNAEKMKKSVYYMKQYLKNKNNKYFIAYYNSVPVGYLHVTYDDKKNKLTSYLSELYVFDLYRKLGIGKKLVLFQLKYLKKIKITRNKLTTTKYKNKRVINFYKKLGYILTKEDKKENTIYLSKKIS